MAALRPKFSLLLIFLRLAGAATFIVIGLASDRASNRITTPPSAAATGTVARAASVLARASATRVAGGTTLACVAGV